ncbi:MAG: hypothetical protein ABFS08_02985 [Pseudomonadota bacterium]
MTVVSVLNYVAYWLVNSSSLVRSLQRSGQMGAALASRACEKLATSMIPWIILADRKLFFALKNHGCLRAAAEGLRLSFTTTTSLKSTLK